MCPNYRAIKLEPALQSKKTKLNICHNIYAHVVHSTARQVISRRGKNENVGEMSKNENCTSKACKTVVFHCQICKFVTFLSQSSSWLRKLANEKYKLYRNKILSLIRITLTI